MALIGKSRVVKKAKKREVKGLEKYEIDLSHVSDLDQQLNDAYDNFHPKPVEYHNRRDLVRIFNAIAKELYAKSGDVPVVEGFGSFVMDMFNAGSDLDLSVNFSHNEVEFPRQRKIRVLRKFAKKFYSLQKGGHVTGIQVITTAKVPIVKVIDQGTGIECDLSIENRDGIMKSEIIHIVSAIDERFQKLSCLMKAWAKAHGINSSKDRTLNSLSIISMVAFHLQTQDPPILPPFCTLFKDGTEPAAVKKVVQNYLNYGKENKESLSKLFITLFIKLASVEKLWHKGLCLSLYEGSWISKALGPISVEDFTDRSQNVARAVGQKQFQMIYKFIHQSLQQLLGFFDGYVEEPKLKKFLFGMDSASQGDNVDRNLDKTRVKVPVHQDSRPTKKRHLTDSVTQGDGSNKNLDESTVNLPINQDTHPAKKICVTDREGTQVAKVWGGTQVTKAWGGTQIAKGWGSEQLVNGWGQTQLAGGWEGTWLNGVLNGAWRSEGWGGSRIAKIWGGIPLVNGWGGWQQVDSWGRKLNADNWGVNQPSNNNIFM